ncbi:unnamed protein product [Euphydryas editha]|uniref:Ubinuclein-1 n=1 Tax=Euphydryas editha TaxID=104508 RepID=A0AAU9TPR4_EUPED|nr:unnamed protein product [Euphydryas editha]
MSDPKRATLITASAPKSAKNTVNKSVRLTINLDESTESKYPELNYKELLIAAATKERRQNGKTAGLDPFSDNDDDVELVAKKFEQKYGGKSTYGKKGRHDEFADIGAGYDENDSFIDNTDGYDEMIPPGSDTLYGGFYINCGSLEFKAVPENKSSDADSNRRNKRRISSSSSEESESSSDSDSEEAKGPGALANGAVDSHDTEHRKKKNKNISKKQAKKVRRTDSSAATSGKQTSDDNAQGDGESDSRTSQSDSLTSKPAPSSETAVTSDSSRDAESKLDVKLPEAVSKLLEELEAFSQQSRESLSDDNKTDQFIIRVERALSASGAVSGARRVVYERAARALRQSRADLLRRARALADRAVSNTSEIAQSNTANTISSTTTNVTTNIATNVTASRNNSVPSKRKAEELLEKIDIDKLTPEEKEAKIVEALQKLKVLIEERTPGMMATYNAECERVQEEKKKQQEGEGERGERRLPKRRFPWCARARALLARLAALGGAPAAPDAAAALLVARALPLFPPGFVRVPTLLRQADLNKDIKASDLKRQRIGSSSQSALANAQFTEPIQFPSSLTVTTSVKSYDKQEGETDPKYKVNPAAVYGSIMNPYSLNKDLVIETSDDRKKDLDRSKEDSYIPNNIGSITITPVPNSQKDRNITTIKDKGKEPLLRVKSPAALNEMVHKKEKEKQKKPDKSAPVSREKRVQSPLHIDTNYQTKKSSPSPKAKDEIAPKTIEAMRIAESNIPRPGLVAVHHSPTFAKPDKRPPEVKKKKEILIVSDVDPLADVPQEVDDSSSDVEFVDVKIDKNEPKSSESKSVTVPLKDKVSVDSRKVNSVKQKSEKNFNSIKECRKEQLDEDTRKDFDAIMRNIREMEVRFRP